MAPVARRAVRWLPHPAPPPRARAPPSAARRHVRFDVATEPRRDVPTSVHAGEGAQRHDVGHHKRPATRRESEPCLGECGRSRSLGNVGSARVRLPHCMHPSPLYASTTLGIYRYMHLHLSPLHLLLSSTYASTPFPTAYIHHYMHPSPLYASTTASIHYCMLLHKGASTFLEGCIAPISDGSDPMAPSDTRISVVLAV